MAVPQLHMDGRLARGLRARSAIVDAMLALIDEGDLRPSAARVAERAGVSLRTVFQHFRDMETLLDTAAERQRVRLTAIYKPLPDTGPWATRLQVFVRQRAALLEDVAPVRRAGLLCAPFSAVVSRRLRDFRAIKASEARRVFARELDALPAAQRRTAAAALVVATSWSAWEELRAYQRLSLADARRAMQYAIEAILRPRAAAKEERA
jgi:TetR/AcrR family transcriptional regulator of autoinduction and epiphytic fitness